MKEGEAAGNRRGSARYGSPPRIMGSVEKAVLIWR